MVSFSKYSILCLTLLFTLTLSLAFAQSTGPAIFTNDSGKWVDCPNMPAGCQMMLLYGNPSQSGDFGVRIQEAELPSEEFDLVIARWVLSFLPEAASLVRRIAHSLRLSHHGLVRANRASSCRFSTVFVVLREKDWCQGSQRTDSPVVRARPGPRDCRRNRTTGRG